MMSTKDGDHFWLRATVASFGTALAWASVALVVTSIIVRTRFDDDSAKAFITIVVGTLVSAHVGSTMTAPAVYRWLSRPWRSIEDGEG